MEEEENEIRDENEIEAVGPEPEIPEPGILRLEEHERIHAIFAGVADNVPAPIDPPAQAVMPNGAARFRELVEQAQMRWDRIDEAQRQDGELEEVRQVERDVLDPFGLQFGEQRVQFNNVANPLAAPYLGAVAGRARFFPNPLNEEFRAVMNYDQLVRRCPALTDRYIPDLSNRNNAARALQQFEQDQSGTPAEREALVQYLNGHIQVSNTNYNWCAECEMMVGFENHTHCPFCTYAMVPRRVEEVRAPHHRAECGNCNECCRQKGHRRCPTCDTHMERGCRHCAQCTNCCKCALCTSPDCQYMQECEDCKKCYDHCICTALATSDPNGKTFPASKISERRQFDCTRFSGIEWEYNRADTRAMDYWTRKWRGHIHRDDSCGYEAVTVPVAGDHMVNCVTSMGKVLARATIDNRCSIHAHVDAADLQWTDMFRFLELYARVEPILYMIAGQERLDNRYAVPIGKEYEAALKRVDRKDAIMAVAFCPIERETGRKQPLTTVPDHGRNAQREKPGRRADNHAYCRRKGLNILPWLAGRGPRPSTPVLVPVKANDTLEKLSFRLGVSVAALMRWNKIKPGGKLGKTIVVNKRTIAPDTTIEFRIHPNTHDPIRVINWVKVVTRLVEWSVKNTDKDLENLPKSALRILCQHVAPECAPWIMTRVQEWRKETSRANGRQARRITIKGGRYKY